GDDVERDLARIGAPLLVSTVDAIVGGTIRETPQDESGATYAPRLTKEDGVLRWDEPADRVHDRIRGLHPWPLAFSFLAGRRIILRRSTVVSPDHAGAPGVVLKAAGDELVV